MIGRQIDPKNSAELFLKKIRSLLRGLLPLIATLALPLTVTAAQITLPSPWSDGDIGATGQPGSSGYANGTFTVSGAGAMIFGSADAFHFVYQPLTGDGTIVARLVSLQGPSSTYTSAGVMIRNTLDAASANLNTAEWLNYKSVYFDVRTASGAYTNQTGGVSVTLPYWVKVVRSGNVFLSYASADGVNWVQQGTTQSVPMGQSVYFGLAVSSGSTTALATATFDNVSVSSISQPLPSPWLDADLGSVGVGGNASYSNGTFTVDGGGAMIFGSADAFHFVYQPLTGDGTIVARLVSLQGPSSPYASAGVMIRNTLDATAANATAAEWAYYKSAYFDIRTASGAYTNQTGGVSATLPYWIKVSRSGSAFSSYASADGVNWTQIATSQTITMGTTVYVGLAVTSGNTSALAGATFDNVSVDTPPPPPTPSFTLSASPASVTTTQRATGASTTVNVTPTNGFSGNVSLTATGMPNGVTASFNPSSTASTSTLTLTASSTAVTGIATVTITGTSGSLTATTTVTLTVNPAPVAPGITTQPVNQTVTAGQTASFTVAATGTAPLSYQWQKNGVNIAGATAASYTTPATTSADNGSSFVVIVSNSQGNAKSTAAILTVNAAPATPSITTQPVNQTVTAGQTASFTVAATGTAPLSYQWKKNGVSIAGATAASYTTPATTTADSGSTFAVVVSNSAGSVTSSPATLTVNPAPVAPGITTQPVNQTVTAGQTASFTVVATGTAPLSYQWKKNGVSVAGATAASYTTPATTTADSGSTFAVVVSNSAGSVTSSAVTLTVNSAPAPAIQVNPTSVNFANDPVGTNLSQALIIKNTGSAALTISQVTATGSAFSVSGFSIPFSVAAGQQTTITVVFLPTAVGGASGNISIASNAPTSPTSVGLSGTGIVATFTLGVRPTSLSFGNVTTGTSSAMQNVTVTNVGNSNVTISKITLSGAAYSMTGGSTPVTLTPSQNIMLSVLFSPTVAGTASGNISIVSNASGSPSAVSLTGTGVAVAQHSVALTWNASSSTVAGYNVYRSTVSGGPFTRINPSLVPGLSYIDSMVQRGTTYYYLITAVDSGGNESAFSNEASAAIP